jgi:hypothetical protein
LPFSDHFSIHVIQIVTLKAEAVGSFKASEYTSTPARRPPTGEERKKNLLTLKVKQSRYRPGVAQRVPGS